MKCIVFLIGIILGVSVVRSQTVQIKTFPEIEYQTMDGFGASDAWRCQFVGKDWPSEKKEAIADLLFSQKTDEHGNPRGIGLSIWRFYISSGTSEQGEKSGIENVWRRGECFQNPDGSYDWNKQAGQQWFLEAAKKRGVERFLAFPNAAPTHMSLNNKGFASKGNGHFNVAPEKLPDYARFLTDVVQHFEKEGIHFDYLSPFNEPQWEWDGGNQEGTPANNEELYSFIKLLSAELDRQNLTTKLVIGEAGTIQHLTKTVKNDHRDNQIAFFFNPKSPNYVGNLSHVANIISGHSYFTVWPLETQVKTRIALDSAIQANNPKLGFWQSEYCILEKNDEIKQGGTRDLGMPTALFVARIIHNDLTICNAKSWQWWTAITKADYKDGLIYLDDGSQETSGRMGFRVESLKSDGQFRDSKLLWALGNYSRFIRPGMVRIKCELSEPQSIKDGLLVSAWKDPKTKALVYVMVNLGNKNSIVDLGNKSVVKSFTTSMTNNLSYSKTRSDQIVIPSKSIVTITL